MILIKLIDNIEMNNIFKVTSIMFIYCFNTVLKSCTFLNHKILGYLVLLFINSSFENIDIGAGGFATKLL